MSKGGVIMSNRVLGQHPESGRPVANPPKLALIGCGAIAEQYYLPALARHPAVLQKLILVDPDLARAQKLGLRFRVRACLGDHRGILDDVDGAIVAVPTHLHYPVSMDFLHRGVHVLCEKPLAESAGKARAMVEEAREAGAVLAVNNLLRLYPSFVEVQQLLASRTLGEPLSITYTLGEEFRWPTVSGFYFDWRSSPGGVLRDRGAHVLDLLCCWLGGKPDLVSSQNDSFGGNEAVAHVRFKHGQCVGEVKLSWFGGYPCRFVIQCEAGSVVGDTHDFQRLVLITASGEKEIKLKSAEKSKLDIGHKMLTNFIRVISMGEKPLVSGNDVLGSIQFIDECYLEATRFDMPWYQVLEADSV
jgi:predicted dehydrogenase